MSNEHDIGSLNARLAAIEKTLESLSRKPSVTELSAEDMATYKKVRDVIAFDSDSVCGINECFKCSVTSCRVCSVCQVCRVCRVCDFECVCGPCSFGGLGGRFRGLGD